MQDLQFELPAAPAPVDMAARMSQSSGARGSERQEQSGNSSDFFSTLTKTAKTAMTTIETSAKTASERISTKDVESAFVSVKTGQ